MAWTAYDSMVRAVQLCGAYAPGEPPSSYVGQIGLDTLNSMRKAWNYEGLTCYGATTIAVTADGSTSYTFGTGGDSATYAPTILQMQYENGDNIQILQQVTFEEYQAQSGKSNAGDPCFWADGGGYPTRTVYVYPAPTNGTLRITLRTPFADIAHLSDPMPEPPEYREAIDYNLALRMAMFPGLGGGESSSSVVAMARESLDRIKRNHAYNNIPRKVLSPIFGGTYSGRGVIEPGGITGSI